MQLPASAVSRPCGVRFAQLDGSATYLPLERAEVHAEVIDVSAIVTITQYFFQYLQDALERAKYVFPIPARAAVCAFKMTAPDGTVIAAVAKEKEQAKREHEAAISQGHTTALVEHVSDDIFSISLGALPSQQMVTTEITYVLDLMEDDVPNQIRLHIPMYVGVRYGTAPEGLHGAVQSPPERVHISVDVRMQAAVRRVTSPSHPTLVLTPGAPTSHRTDFSSLDFLTRDFVLCVEADGLDAPRCFAQRARTGAMALQLSVVPRFALPPVPAQEYVFVVDRSGSMLGARIAMARRALVLLLRALPRQGTRVNIFSFGDRCDSLWVGSRPYDEETLDAATQYVDKMEANYGGTEILEALKKAFNSRDTTLPTACFVVTDGESYDQGRVFETVQQAVAEANPEAPLRVFTLGIGDMASTAMCEGIARAGNGVCLMAATSESIVGKCSRLVRAGRTHVLRHVSVDWGVGAGSDAGAGEIVQAPAQAPSIYPGARFVLTALVAGAQHAPTEVVIRAQRDQHSEVLTQRVPVQTVEAPPDAARPPLVPTLAARRAIMDLEDRARTACPPELKASITQLALEYQLASRFTSFVAVDRRTGTQLELASDRPPAALQRRMYVGRPASDDSDEELSDDVDDGIPSGVPPMSRFLRMDTGSTSSEESEESVPSGRARRAMRRDHHVPAFLDLEADIDTGDEESDDDMGYGIFDDPSDPAPATRAGDATAEDPAVMLVRLQSFDGSFPATPALEAIVGEGLLEKAAELKLNQKLWATLLAVAFLQKHMKDERELLDSLVEKAMEFVSAVPDLDSQSLLARAQNLVA